jgi:hypothetical protein
MAAPLNYSADTHEQTCVKPGPTQTFILNEATQSINPNGVDEYAFSLGALQSSHDCAATIARTALAAYFARS